MRNPVGFKGLYSDYLGMYRFKGTKHGLLHKVLAFRVPPRDPSYSP